MHGFFFFLSFVKAGCYRVLEYFVIHANNMATDIWLPIIYIRVRGLVGATPPPAPEN